MKTGKAVAGHTPGPWQKIRRHDGRPCVVTLDDNDNLEHVVAGPSTTPHNEQDLQLISAAPELLEACKAVYAASTQPGFWIPTEVWVAIHKAIAKAEGNQ